jgi:hypothetical protein
MQSIDEDCGKKKNSQSALWSVFPLPLAFPGMFWVHVIHVLGMLQAGLFFFEIFHVGGLAIIHKRNESNLAKHQIMK